MLQLTCLSEMAESSLLVGDAQEMAACWRTHCARSPGGSCLLQSMADWLAAAIGGRARRLAAAARVSRSDRREGPPADRSDRREGPPAGRSSDLRENHSVLACVDHGGWPTGSNFKLFACVRVDHGWEGWVAHARVQLDGF